MAKKNVGKKTLAKNSKSGKQKTKANPKKKTRPVATKSPVLRSLVGFFLLITVVVATFFAVHLVFPPDNSKTALSDYTRYEIFPKSEDNHFPVTDFPPVIHTKLPQIVLIIDDMGYNRHIAKKFSELDKNITFSVLPNSPHKRSIAIEAHNKGLEIMLHLPMEPFEYPKVNPGPGALLVSMSQEELVTQLSNNIASIPYVKGVNNHMGSRMTSLSSKMYQIFTILKKEKLFFIDSKTAPQSLCKPSARLLQIPFAERDVFIDHFQTPEAIKKQINSLIKKALKTGRAIGIGHPHKVTYEVLKKELPYIKSKVQIVHASKFVKTLG